MTKYIINAHLTNNAINDSSVEIDSTSCIMNIVDDFLGISPTNWTSTKDNVSSATDGTYNATNDTFKLGVRNSHVHSKTLVVDGTKEYRICMNHNYRSTRVGVCYTTNSTLTTHYKTPYSFGVSTDPTNLYMEYRIYVNDSKIYIKGNNNGEESSILLTAVANNQYHLYFYTFTDNETIYSIEEINGG